MKKIIVFIEVRFIIFQRKGFFKLECDLTFGACSFFISDSKFMNKGNT